MSSGSCLQPKTPLCKWQVQQIFYWSQALNMNFYLSEWFQIQKVHLSPSQYVLVPSILPSTETPNLSALWIPKKVYGNEPNSLMKHKKVKKLLLQKSVFNLPPIQLIYSCSHTIVWGQKFYLILIFLISELNFHPERCEALNSSATQGSKSMTRAWQREVLHKSLHHLQPHTATCNTVNYIFSRFTNSWRILVSPFVNGQQKNRKLIRLKQQILWRNTINFFWSYIRFIIF